MKARDLFSVLHSRIGCRALRPVQASPGWAVQRCVVLL
jgi:hypothetical protein